MKKIILFLAFSIFAIQSIEAAKSTTIPGVWHAEGTDLSKENNKVLIGWDLNSVVFDKDVSPSNITDMLNTVRQEHGTRYALWAYSQFFWLWREKKALKRDGDNHGFVWDAMFTKLEEEQGEEGIKLAKVLRQASQQANTLNYPVSQLLYDLHKSGHRNAVLSNMGQSLLDLYVKALDPTKNPKKATLASEYVRNVLLQDHDHKVISSKENGWMHKPEPVMYATFLNQNKDKDFDCKIFVDDKEENCEAAVKNGFDHAIVCDDPNKLSDILDKLNVKNTQRQVGIL